MTKILFTYRTKDNTEKRKQFTVNLTRQYNIVPFIAFPITTINNKMVHPKKIKIYDFH